MPVKLPRGLPAWDTLRREGVPLITTERAIRQDIRPLQIALLNLMPDKKTAEIQFARLLGATPLQLELTLLSLQSYKPTHTSASYMEQFYCSWNDLKAKTFDGMIITGAPIEHLAFQDVAYWSEFCDILRWSLTNVTSTVAICWASQACLYAFYRVPKRMLSQKCFGLFPHRLTDATHPCLLGMNDVFNVPVSRHTATCGSDIAGNPRLKTLIESENNEPCMIEDREIGYIFMLNHLEYDTNSLHHEYQRDGKRQQSGVFEPENYYQSGSALPVNSWRATAHLFFRNWLGHIYDVTPFDLDRIPACRNPAPAEICANLNRC